MLLLLRPAAPGPQAPETSGPPAPEPLAATGLSPAPRRFDPAPDLAPPPASSDFPALRRWLPGPAPRPRPP